MCNTLRLKDQTSRKQDVAKQIEIILKFSRHSAKPSAQTWRHAALMNTNTIYEITTQVNKQEYNNNIYNI